MIYVKFYSKNINFLLNKIQIFDKNDDFLLNVIFVKMDFQQKLMIYVKFIQKTSIFYWIKFKSDICKDGFSAEIDDLCEVLFKKH